MREIKFRAWDELEKRMWTLDDAGEDSGDGSIQYFSENGSLEFGRLEYYDTGLGVNSHFEKFPLMQYTGLKDKNGKEIYEGDIIQQNYKDVYNQSQAFAGEVVYSDCVYWLKNDDEYTFLYDEHRIYNSIVIGNIYENPELLGDSQ